MYNLVQVFSLEIKVLKWCLLSLFNQQIFSLLGEFSKSDTSIEASRKGSSINRKQFCWNKYLFRSEKLSGAEYQPLVQRFKIISLVPPPPSLSLSLSLFFFFFNYLRLILEFLITLLDNGLLHVHVGMLKFISSPSKCGLLNSNLRYLRNSDTKRIPRENKERKTQGFWVKVTAN